MCQNSACRHNTERTVGWKSGGCITAVRHTNLCSWWWILINITREICGKTLWQWKNCQSLFKNSLFATSSETRTPSSFLKCISLFNATSIKFNQSKTVNLKETETEIVWVASQTFSPCKVGFCCSLGLHRKWGWFWKSISHSFSVHTMRFHWNSDRRVLI